MVIRAEVGPLFSKNDVVSCIVEVPDDFKILGCSSRDVNSDEPSQSSLFWALQLELLHDDIRVPLIGAKSLPACYLRRSDPGLRQEPPGR